MNFKIVFTLQTKQIIESVKMDYSKLSNYDINKLVAIKLGYRVKDNFQWEKDLCFVKAYKENEQIKVFDYCGSPYDAWPIILDNKITVNPVGEAWQHKPHPDDYHYEDGVYNESSDKNPLRAAMITFLKMNE